MKKYLFQLGHQPNISIAEIQAVFSHLQITVEFKQQEKYLAVETENELDCKNLIKTLGGTIKIAEKIEENSIVDFLAKIPDEFKIQFSLHGANNKKLGLEAKKELKAMGRSVRYIEPKNTATILHNKLIKKQGDLTILNNEIFVTHAIQPFEEFSERDYKRPGIDSFSGMLPPKLARIMINLGQTSTNATLIDPFCGSGTVLMEALDLGFKNIIGSDISDKAISDTKQNIEWLSDSKNLKPKTCNILATNVTKLSAQIKTNSVDLIVSEPYMGKPLRGNERPETLKRQVNDLAELYILAFKEFKKILKPNGTIIFIIPKFKYDNSWVEIDCLDKIKKAGFEIIPLSEESDSLIYHRPKQHVARVIWKFKKV